MVRGLPDKLVFENTIELLIAWSFYECSRKKIISRVRDYVLTLKKLLI
jgi:hypothetical protein